MTHTGTQIGLDGVVNITSPKVRAAVCKVISQDVHPCKGNKERIGVKGNTFMTIEINVS